MAQVQPSAMLDQFMRQIEPNNKILLDDLRHLAAYMIKVGTNVHLVKGGKFIRQKLAKHKELNLERIEKLVTKYKLIWARDCERVRFDPVRNCNLHHIAHQYPDVFLQVAGEMAPGSYDARRFWWCANNYHFYLDNSTESSKQSKFPTSLLLSDVLCHFLTKDDVQLIVIHALHLSVKHSDSKIYPDWYERNRQWILNRIKLNEFGIPAQLRQKVRTIYMIDQIQKELKLISVDRFIEWWNLTGLRWPSTYAYQSSRQKENTNN